MELTHWTKPIIMSKCSVRIWTVTLSNTLTANSHIFDDEKMEWTPRLDGSAELR